MSTFDMPAQGSWEERGGWVVRRLVEDLGIADFQAAGIVGNLGCESIGFTTLQEIKPLVPGSAGGWGWAQWTAVRRRAFEGWCAQNHLLPTSDEANYGFLLHELKGDYESTVKSLKGCRTLDSAVFSVGQTYERPAGTTRTHLPGYESRLDWGRRALVGARLSTLPIDPIHPILRRGAKGDPVREVQRRLIALGFSCGPHGADGDFGGDTEKAVKAFQEARLILVPGEVGRSTWNELAHAEAERST